MVDLSTVAPPERADTEVVADLVEKYLHRHQPADYRLAVNRKAVVRGNNRWLVEVDVEPQGKEVHADDFIDRLTMANLDLDRDFPRYIRLTPMAPQPGEVL